MFCKRASDKELPVASWLHWHNLTSILLVKIFGQYFPKPVKMMMTWRCRRHHDFQKFLPNWYPHSPQLLIKATTAALNAFCDLLLHLRLQLKMRYVRYTKSCAHWTKATKLCPKICYNQTIETSFNKVLGWALFIKRNLRFELLWIAWLASLEFYDFFVTFVNTLNSI